MLKSVVVDGGSTVLDASELHGQLIKEAAMGQGFDRHLFAIRHQAKVSGLEEPLFFGCDAYKWMNYNILSTSTLTSDAVTAGAFGPVVEDGFGLGYGIKTDGYGSVVSSYQGDSAISDFIGQCREAISWLYETMEKKSSDS